MSESFCSGCNHSLSRHYKDVTGVVRCLVLEVHISSGGLTGFLANYMCDCADGISESADKERQRKAEEKRKFDEAVNKITDGIKDHVKENIAQKEAEEPKLCTTSGKPIDEHTREINPATGQQKDYIILCESERAKGFVRPYRESYKHVGIRPTHPVRDLTEEENERYFNMGYVKYEKYPDEEGLTGRFWTQAQLNSGCGTVTTMKKSISETYAAKPDFYGATFCCACGNHYPVEEFVWVDMNGVVLTDRLGS